MKFPNTEQSHLLNALNFYLCICLFLLLFKYNCVHFHPTMPPNPTHPCPPPSSPPCLALSMCPSYMFLDAHTPHCPLPLSSCLVTVRLFFFMHYISLFELSTNYKFQLFFTCLWYVSGGEGTYLKPLSHCWEHHSMFIDLNENNVFFILRYLCLER